MAIEGEKTTNHSLIAKLSNILASGLLLTLAILSLKGGFDWPSSMIGIYALVTASFMLINEFWRFTVLVNNCQFLFNYWGKAFFWSFWSFVTWYNSGWKLAFSIALMIIAVMNIFYGCILEPIVAKDIVKGEIKPR